MTLRRWVREGGWLLGAVAGTTTAMVIVLRLWRADLRVPFYNNADATRAAGHVNTVLQFGWYFDNPRMGFPDGGHWRDYPLSNGWHFVALRLFSVISHDWALAMNLMYLGSFLLVTATAYLALRALGVRAPVAAGGGIVMAFVPYHMARSETHLFLGDYSIVPLVIALGVAQLSDRPWLRFQRGRPASWPRLVAAIAIVVLVGGLGTYYAVMSALLLGVTGLLASIGRRSLEPLLSAVALGAVIAVVLGAQLLPTYLYSHEHGHNSAFDRELGESDRYSLRPVLLFLPNANHRIDALGAPARKYLALPNQSERGQALGLVGAAGLLGLMIFSVTPLAGGRGLRAPTDRSLALFGFASLGLGIVAGGGTALGLAGFTEMRAWNRISIFLAFIGVAAAARAFDRFLAARRLSTPLVALAAAGCVLLALFDQTSAVNAQPYRRVEARVEEAQAFVKGIEETVGPDAAILQLPYVRYPEVRDINEMTDYSHMLGFLSSDSLRWSYGAIKGRKGWQDGQRDLPLPDQLRRARETGFSAVWVDRAGYEDHGELLEKELQECVGPPLLESRSRRRVLYDLRTEPRC